MDIYHTHMFEYYLHIEQLNISIVLVWNFHNNMLIISKTIHTKTMMYAIEDYKLIPKTMQLHAIKSNICILNWNMKNDEPHCSLWLNVFNLVNTNEQRYIPINRSIFIMKYVKNTRIFCEICILKSSDLKENAD